MELHNYSITYHYKGEIYNTQVEVPGDMRKALDRFAEVKRFDNILSCILLPDVNPEPETYSIISDRGKTLAYLSTAYFDEIVYRLQNTDGFVRVAIKEPVEWLNMFRQCQTGTVTLTPYKHNIYTIYVEGGI